MYTFRVLGFFWPPWKTDSILDSGGTPEFSGWYLCIDTTKYRT